MSLKIHMHSYCYLDKRGTISSPNTPATMPIVMSVDPRVCFAFAIGNVAACFTGCACLIASCSCITQHSYQCLLSSNTTHDVLCYQSICRHAITVASRFAHVY